MLPWKQLGNIIFIFLEDFLKKEGVWGTFFMTDANRNRTQKYTTHTNTHTRRCICISFCLQNQYKWWLLAIWPSVFPSFCYSEDLAPFFFNFRNQVPCLPSKKYFQIVFSDKELLQLPSATWPNTRETLHSWLNFTSILGVWNQSHSLSSAFKTKWKQLFIILWVKTLCTLDQHYGFSVRIMPTSSFHLS